MVDLLKLIQLPGLMPAVPLRAAPVLRSIPTVAMPQLPDFGKALAALAQTADTASTDGDRQDPAESGKDLPEGEEIAEPLIPWLPAPLSSPAEPASPAIILPAPPMQTASVDAADAAEATPVPDRPTAAPWVDAAAPLMDRAGSVSLAPTLPVDVAARVPTVAREAEDPLSPPHLPQAPAAFAETIMPRARDTISLPAPLTGSAAIANPVSPAPPVLPAPLTPPDAPVSPVPDTPMTGKGLSLDASVPGASLPSPAVERDPMAERAVRRSEPTLVPLAVAPAAAVVQPIAQLFAGAIRIAADAVAVTDAPPPAAIVLPEQLTPPDAPVSPVSDTPMTGEGPSLDASVPGAPLPSPAVERDPMAERAVRRSEPTLVPLAPVHQTPLAVAPAAAVVQSAAQLFAGAIRMAADAVAATDAPPPAAIVLPEQLRAAVQAMSAADQPPLDMQRDDWTGAMIDRIAALRDAAEASDTRIRLSPDNLGTVDISIRRDGDRLHVHFAAEAQATRQLLAEAAPRLAELADARGVKLGQTSVDAGTGGQPQARQQSHSDAPGRPVSATSDGAPATDDDRIA